MLHQEIKPWMRISWLPYICQTSKPYFGTKSREKPSFTCLRNMINSSKVFQKVSRLVKGQRISINLLNNSSIAHKFLRSNRITQYNLIALIRLAIRSENGIAFDPAYASIELEVDSFSFTHSLQVVTEFIAIDCELTRSKRPPTDWSLL